MINNKSERANNFILRAHNIHDNKYDYCKVNYQNNYTKVDIICPIHGKFEQTPSLHLKGSGCVQCHHESITKSLEKFITEAIKFHGDKYDYSEVNYENALTKVIIICREHGEFEQTPANHLRGEGCSKCYNKKRTKTTEKFIEEANRCHNNKYDYNKTEYINNNTEIIIHCFIHGDFKQTPRNHLSGSGCKDCANSRKSKIIPKSRRTIEFIREFCKSIGYKCLSNNYENGKVKLDLICNNNHSCGISFNNLFNHGRRCVYCSKRPPKSLQYVLDFCNKIGWECLENNYKNCVTKMLFKCPNGHKILKNFRDLENGKGCKICLKLTKPTLEEVIKYCNSIGFVCLSKNYENARSKLKLKCCNDHIFYCCLDKLKHGRGCSYCKSSRAEKMIKYIIETLTGKIFEKIRPDFLKFTKTNRNLEIDMFNFELNIGFEYQGNQHFEIVKKFKMTENNLLEYQIRDLFKKEACQNNGIKLICIPPIVYNKNKYEPLEIKNMIVDILKENNVPFKDKNLVSEDIIRAGNTNR